MLGIGELKTTVKNRCDNIYKSEATRALVLGFYLKIN
jgi:hypothetical protein